MTQCVDGSSEWIGFAHRLNSMFWWQSVRSVLNDSITWNIVMILIVRAFWRWLNLSHWLNALAEQSLFYIKWWQFGFFSQSTFYLQMLVNDHWSNMFFLHEFYELACAMELAWSIGNLHVIFYKRQFDAVFVSNIIWLVL